MKTHRCKQLLESNKDYNNGFKVSIRYGYRWDNFKNKKEIGWWLRYLEHDSEWDFEYMSTVKKIDYCPCCGERLENYEDEDL